MKRFALLTLALCLLSSCEMFRDTTYDTKNYPRNPFEDIQSVCVLPWLNETGELFDVDQLGNICASELVKFPGFRGIRYPRPVRKIIGEGMVITSIEEALKIGRQLKVDAILAVSVNQFDTFNPPRIAVTVQLLRVTARQLSVAQIDKITMSASWQYGPYDLSRQHAGYFAGAFDAVYDASAQTLQDEIKSYAAAQKAKNRGRQDIQEYLMVQHRFIQFVSSQIINRIFKEARRPL